MSQSQIACPACGHRFELTQAMAAPIEAQLRAQFEAQGEARRKELDARERELAARAAATARAQENIDEQVGAKLAAERATLAADLTAKAKADVGLGLKALQEQAEEQSRKLPFGAPISHPDIALVDETDGCLATSLPVSMDWSTELHLKPRGRACLEGPAGHALVPGGEVPKGRPAPLASANQVGGSDRLWNL